MPQSRRSNTVPRRERGLPATAYLNACVAKAYESRVPEDTFCQLICLGELLAHHPHYQREARALLGLKKLEAALQQLDQDANTL